MEMENFQQIVGIRAGNRTSHILVEITKFMGILPYLNNQDLSGIARNSCAISCSPSRADVICIMSCNCECSEKISTVSNFKKE